MLCSNIQKLSVSYSVDDIAAAKTFYQNTLGLLVEEDEMGNLAIRLLDGGDILIYYKPDHVPASFTVLNFLVDDIEKAVEELTSK